MEAPAQDTPLQSSCPPQGGAGGEGPEPGLSFCLCGRAVDPNRKLVQDLQAEVDALLVERSSAEAEIASARAHYDDVNQRLTRARQQLVALRCLPSPLPR